MGPPRMGPVTCVLHGHLYSHESYLMDLGSPADDMAFHIRDACQVG